MNGYGGGYDDGYGNQYGYGNNGGAYAADYGYYGNTMSYVQPDYRPGAFRDGRQPPLQQRAQRRGVPVLCVADGGSKLLGVVR